MSKIVVIIPAYNEDENIVRLSKKILKYIPQALIYIIDDTKETTVEKFFKKNSKVKYILRKGKRGRGSAVLYGLKKSKKIKSVRFL